MNNNKQQIAICSGCDEKYFPLMQEMLASVRDFKDAQGFNYCILNTGLNDTQVKQLQDQGCTVVCPEWPTKDAERKAAGKEFLKSCVCRPFLNQYFPNNDIYIWLDADAWVQNFEAIELLIKGATKSDLAIVPQVDRSYKKAVRISWFLGLPLKIRGFYSSNARKAFGNKLAQKLLPYHVLNAGVFAITGSAPHWQAWQSKVKQALKKGKVFTAEQLTLGMIVHLDGYKAEFLPATCNWLCDIKPLWDENKEKFVEPYLPHNEIGIVHVSGYDEMRLDSKVTTTIHKVSGDQIEKSLRHLKKRA